MRPRGIQEFRIVGQHRDGLEGLAQSLEKQGREFREREKRSGVGGEDSDMSENGRVPASIRSHDCNESACL